jgi:hypothetical protein
LENVYPQMQQRKALGDEFAQTWIDCFQALGKKLGIKVT